MENQVTGRSLLAQIISDLELPPLATDRLTQAFEAQLNAGLGTDRVLAAVVSQIPGVKQKAEEADIELREFVSAAVAEATDKIEAGEGVELPDEPEEPEEPEEPDTGDTGMLTLAEALAAEELPEKYKLSDANLSINIEEASTLAEIEAQIEAQKAAAQAIIDGATNAEELELNLEASYSVEDSAENILAAAEAENELVADISKITLTDKNITAEQRDALIELGFAEDALPNLQGDTLELTEEADEIVGTENDDTIIAEVAAKAKESTLNAEDQIDGGAGNDTLKVTLENNFGGFKGDGGVKNVENIELTNNHAKGTKVDFDATGVEGATNYTVKDGVVNLKNLGKEATQVNLENIASGTQEIAHTEALAELNLGLNQVGSTATAVEVNSNAKSLVVTATDANNIDLTASAAENLTVNGAGDLTLKAAATKLTSVDASELAGAANLTLTNSGELANLTTGAGDDTITVDAKALAVDAEIDGGAGNNTLVLTGSGTTMTYTLNNIQTLDATKLTGTTTFIGENVADVNTINLGGASSGVTTNFYELENLSDLTLNININAKGKFTLDNAGETTINDAGAASGATLTLLEATDVTLNADKGTNITLEAYAAESLTAQGTFGSAKITVSEADEITLNQVAGKLELKAAAATQLTIDATTAGFEVTSSSVLNSLEELTIATKGASSEGVKFGVTLDSLSELTLTGIGDVTLGALAANADDSLTINANGINALTTRKIGGNVDSIEAEINARGAIKLGNSASQGIKATDSIELDIKTNGVISLGGSSASAAIEAKDIEITLNTTVDSGTTLGLLKADDITLDVSKVINGVAFKGMEVGNSLEFIGAKNKENTFSSGSSIEITGSDVTLDLTGGIKDDSFHITFGSGSGSNKFALTGDLGLSHSSGDSITIDASANSAALILDLTEIENVDKVDITLGSSNSKTDVIKIGDNFAGLTGSGKFKIANFKASGSKMDKIDLDITVGSENFAGQSTAVSSFTSFTISSNTYSVVIVGGSSTSSASVFIDLDGDGVWNENNDLRIDLTGIKASDLDASNFI